MYEKEFWTISLSNKRVEVTIGEGEQGEQGCTFKKKS